jgi:hypothetical protein
LEIRFHICTAQNGNQPALGGVFYIDPIKTFGEPMSNNSFWLPSVIFLLLTACASTLPQEESRAKSQPGTVLQVAATFTPPADNSSASCPVTQPPKSPFIPPTPYPAEPPPEYKEFWYGTPELWTMLRFDGTWNGLPHNASGYTQKIAWWRQGYDIYTEPNPELIVTGKRLDVSAPPLLASRATNARTELGDLMMIGVDIPTLGCWEITGQYNGHELSFVVWVAP